MFGKMYNFHNFCYNIILKLLFIGNMLDEIVTVIVYSQHKTEYKSVYYNNYNLIISDSITC